MTRKMFLHGLALAVTLMVPALAAPKTSVASCCATKTRCCDKVKFCCDQPDKAECCQKGIACCDKTPCCGPTEKVKPAAKKAAAPGCCAPKVKKAAAEQPVLVAVVRCNVTGQPKTACCPTKASPMPPCCQKSCDVLVA